MPEYVKTDKRIYDLFMESAELSLVVFRTTVGAIIVLLLTVVTSQILAHIGILDAIFASSLLFAAPMTMLIAGFAAILAHSEYRFSIEMSKHHMSWKAYET